MCVERCPQCNASNANVDVDAAERDMRLVGMGYNLKDLEDDNPYNNWNIG